MGQNTNLGILLLCAPLAAAAERGPDRSRAVLDSARPARIPRASSPRIRLAQSGRPRPSCRPPRRRRGRARAHCATRWPRPPTATGSPAPTSRGFADVPAIGLRGPAPRRAPPGSIRPGAPPRSTSPILRVGARQPCRRASTATAAAEGVRREVEAALAGIDLADAAGRRRCSPSTRR
ncbi:hypothetical protein ACU4GR_00350 [Methylobacterium oryzae CBMB20]